MSPTKGAAAPILLDLGNGWHRIDSGYLHPGHAAIYLLACDGEAAIYDCGIGTSATRVGDALAQLGLAPGALRHVIVSHPHLDHCAGAGAMLAAFPAAGALAHAKALPHLIDPSRLIAGARQVYGEPFDRLYGQIDAAPSGRVKAVAEGGKIAVGGRTLEMLDTPGHIFSHISVLDRAGDCLLAGDSFGVFSPPSHFDVPLVLRVAAAPTQFSPADFKRTARRIAALAPATILATHFGAVTGDLAAQAELLCDEVDAFVAMAKEADSAADPQRSLSDQLARYWYPRLGLPVDSNLLELDIMLNTLGLDLWRARQMERYLAGAGG